MKHNIFDSAISYPEESRKSIFDLYKQNNTMDKDFQRIATLLHSEHGIVRKYHQSEKYSVYDVSNLLFSKWANRGRCLDLDDFLKTIEFDKTEVKAPYNIKDFLTYIEVVCNMWHISDAYVSNHPESYIWGKDGLAIKKIIDEVLSEMNQKAYYDPETERCLIGEDSAQVTAAVEATEPETASQILHYNHRQLAGDLEKKKSILNSLAKYLEGRELELKSVCGKQLATDLNSAFNNLDIRHNNLAPRDSFDYKDKLAKMPSKELEKWYDDVYQLVLLAILEMDNVERRKNLRELIQKLNSNEKSEDR